MPQSGNLYARVATGTSVGTTIGTFDAINTRNGNLRLEDKASRIHGLTFGGARADQTTATAVMGRLRIVGPDEVVGVGADFLVGSVNGSGIATQSMSYFAPCEWIPVEMPVTGGITCNLFFSQVGIEPADNWSVVAGVAHAVGSLPGPWVMAADLGRCLPAAYSVSSNGAGVSATTATTLVAATIPGRFSQLVSLRPHQSPDPLPTTTEESVAWLDVQNNFGAAPQEWPTPSIGAALLGTLVGGGVTGWQDPLPMYCRKDTGVERTVEPFLNILTTISAANSWGYSIGLRK